MGLLIAKNLKHRVYMSWTTWKWNHGRETTCKTGEGFQLQPCSIFSSWFWWNSSDMKHNPFICNKWHVVTKVSPSTHRILAKKKDFTNLATGSKLECDWRGLDASWWSCRSDPRVIPIPWPVATCWKLRGWQNLRNTRQETITDGKIAGEWPLIGGNYQTWRQNGKIVKQPLKEKQINYAHASANTKSFAYICSKIWLYPHVTKYPIQTPHVASCQCSNLQLAQENQYLWS